MLEELTETLAMAKKLNRILIIEGTVDFDTSDAIVIDCAEHVDTEINGYTVFKNAEYLKPRQLTTIRQNWDVGSYPIVIWANKPIKIDGHLKWRSMFFKVD